MLGDKPKGLTPPDIKIAKRLTIKNSPEITKQFADIDDGVYIAEITEDDHKIVLKNQTAEKSNALKNYKKLVGKMLKISLYGFLNLMEHVGFQNIYLS